MRARAAFGAGKKRITKSRLRPVLNLIGRKDRDIFFANLRAQLSKANAILDDFDTQFKISLNTCDMLW